MKKITLASIALVSLLFIGCGEKPADANATETNVIEVNETNGTEPVIMEENTTVVAEENVTVDANATDANAT
ncbi:MAG: hypothetical protein IE881_02035, partial [Epsilonproteobacteria bacterium]|nr:hypothetical protein [Campylobacterota bacterium]